MAISRPQAEGRRTLGPDDFPTTVVVAVRDAEAEISDAIEHLTLLKYRGALEILVVVNGSTDDTAQRARDMGSVVESRGWSLRVLELEEPGKPNALRLAEAAARPGVLVICDVRVRPSSGALVAVLAGIHRDGLKLASGELRYTPGKSRLVNAFARAYFRAPFTRGDDIHGTFMAFASEHRRIVGEMPDIGADDRCFLLSTPRADRRRVSDAHVDYPFPDRFLGLLQQQIRWKQTNRASNLEFPHADRPAHEGDRWPYFTAPRPRIGDIVVYGAVTAFATIWARVVPSRKPGW